MIPLPVANALFAGLFALGLILLRLGRHLWKGSA